MMMRCKFRLNGVHFVSPEGCKVSFGAVYEPDEKKRLDPANENAIFGKYTPHGSFEATIYNEQLNAQFPKLMGREFYLDFTLLPPADPAS